ncbi:MAG: hypothetical protein ABI442_15635 [Gemmatimonadaceae bacterium]
MPLTLAPPHVDTVVRRDSTAGVQIQLDSANKEVVLSVSGIRLAAAMAYGQAHAQTNIAFVWPFRGWARGYRIDVVDSAGGVLPRTALHHAGVVNLSRRQVAYPMAERLVAAAHETPSVMLPGSMGVPLEPDQHMVLYYMLVNPTAHAMDGVTLRITIAWTPDRADGPRDVFPLYLDANPAIGRYDLPPGVSTTTAEFSLPVGGRVRALGGHAHDYAVELRLEDAVTNRVLVRLTTKRDGDGHIISITTDRFVFTRNGLHLDANRRYRVVGVYDNPTCGPIPRGGMAFMVGPFAPDDVRRWPAIDPTDPLFQQDYADLMAPAADITQPHVIAGMVGMENTPGVSDDAHHRPQAAVAPSCSNAVK